MAQGNPNPSPATRFKPGQSGNPSGISSERQKILHEAAERAERVYLKMITQLENKINDNPEEEVALMAIKADVLKLLKDVQDRAYGTPKQSVDLSSKDGSMTPPSRVELVSVGKREAD